MDDELTSEQRDALGVLKTSRGACPPAETLVEYGELSSDNRARHSAHDHISICSRCQLVLLHAGDATPTRVSNLRWMLPIAALLVLAIGASVVWRTGALPPPAPADTVRGSDIQPVAPIGTVNAINEFSWVSPIRADRYRVVVFRGSSIVWQTETTGTKVTPPGNVNFPAGGTELRWIVEAIDREGEVRMTSPPQSFRYVPKIY
jgi:hypothetical protein